MISVSQAEAIILDTLLEIPNQNVPLSQAFGTVLQQDIKADRDFPPFDRVTMDGIAIRYADFEQGVRRFQISSIQAAGMPQQNLDKAEHCIEIMTGASCPLGADTIIRYEDIKIIEGDSGPRFAELQVEAVKFRQNIHFQGTDHKAGLVLVSSGRRIEAPEIAIAASSGYTHLEVRKSPKIAIISTGDELVEIETQPLPHQIRRSNGYMIQAALEAWGVKAATFHIVDDPASMRETLQRIMDQFPILILSGGVSKGKFDFIPDTLAELGIEKKFHRIAQRPGKPFWFGCNKEQSHILFALPGNPVSTFVNFHRYFRPWFRASIGVGSLPKQFAKLKEDFSFKPALTYFLQVKTEVDESGQIWAQPIEGHGSGDFVNLLKVNALLELPASRNDFFKGESFPLYRFRAD
ncbi:MAG: molybdopterin molybdotransferase MoeA [Bacteroidota bacterium]